MAEYRRINWETRREGDQIYISENVVRKPRFEPEPELEYDHVKQTRINREKRRKKEQAKVMDPKYLRFLIRCAVVVFAVVAVNLCMSSRTSKAKSRIKELNSAVTKLKTANDEMENTLKININQQELQRVAMEELGMVYATPQQVVLYDGEESEYVRQYEAIPAAE